MTLINSHFLDLPGNYLFAEVARRVAAHQATNPAERLIRMGIGDVTRPLVPAVIDALHAAVDEQAQAGGFKGYGPEQGYAFLREAIVATEYQGLGITPDDVFISDGAKCDLGNFQELFPKEAVVAITDPVYPAYADANVMAGRAGKQDAQGRFAGLVYLPCTAENDYVPELPTVRPDIIYLCYPNNPTGTVLTKDQLKVWVDYARKVDAVIFFDAAYEAFIREDGIPHSIYEVDGAHEVAIEFRSYSKTAGFTGLRCGFVVAPRTVTGKAPDGCRVPFATLWDRRQATKYNGCPYIVQRAAAAVHTDQGRAEVRQVIDGYLENASMIREAFVAMGLSVAGGVNGPYVWLRLPGAMDSWDFFARLLAEANIVGTPGAGFGPSGRHCFRFTGFGSREDTLEAIDRLKRFSL